jgi:hypothetical protein
MSFPQGISYEPWPSLSVPDFAATQHLLHAGAERAGWDPHLVGSVIPEWLQRDARDLSDKS